MQLDVYSRLKSLEFSGIKLGLQNIRTLLESLGNPHRKFLSILIAGTNGKGSVGAMLERVLVQHQVPTGCYVSPHLVDIRERIRVNGRMISSSDFESCLQHVFSAIDHLIESGQLLFPPTYFETLTAAAFHHFRVSGVEWAVVEVGMGGRLDATNTLDQNLSIITTIDLDHEQYLGSTVVEVASEKAGILKKDSPVVVGAIPAEALDVIQSSARRLGCSLTGWDASAVSGLELVDGFPVFEYLPWEERVRVGLRGSHQAQNAAVALLACDQLERLGMRIDRNKVLNALESISWPGRLDFISKEPPILVDCAHNVQGVGALAGFLKETQWNRSIVLFTAMKDKNVTSMLSAIAGKIETAVLTRVDPLQRCASMDQLAKACRDSEIPATTQQEFPVAFHDAVQLAIRQRLPLVVFGSIYLAGAVLNLHGHRP